MAGRVTCVFSSPRTLTRPSPHDHVPSTGRGRLFCLEKSG
jgi:hypothetical protein